MLDHPPMSIDWNAFTPASAVIGGAIIGGAAALFAVLNGRIAGVSGILGGLARPQAGDVSWRIAFVAGLVAAPLALLAALRRSGSMRVSPRWWQRGCWSASAPATADGCTSGHGVCGHLASVAALDRATVAFMAAGFATVYAARHLITL